MVTTVEKRIIVNTIYKQTGLSNLYNQVNFVKQIGQRFRDVSTTFQRSFSGGVLENRLKETTKGFNFLSGAISKTAGIFSVITMVGGTLFRVFRGIVGTVWNLGKGVYNLIKRLAHFRAEWLSVMFISMMVSATLMGIVNSVLQTTGVFEIFRITLIALMLPVMMPLIEIMMEMLQWFLDLPPNVQELIAWIILLGAAFTTSLVFLSQAALLMSSLGLSLGSLLVLLTPFAAAIGGATLAVALFGDEAEGMADSLIEMIEGGVDMAVDFINQFTNTFTQNLPLITQIASNVMDALLNGLYQILTALSPFVSSFMNALVTVWNENKQTVYDIAEIIIDWLIMGITLFSPLLFDLGINILIKLLEGIKKNMELMKPAMSSIIKSLSDALPDVTDLIVSIGMDVLKILSEGLADPENKKNLMDAFNTLLDFIHEVITHLTGPLIDVGLKIAWAIFCGISDGLDNWLEEKLSSLANWITNKLGFGATEYTGLNAPLGSLLGSTTNPYGDFIIRPGQPPMTFSPDDTIIGAKGEGLDNIGGGTVNYSPTYYITVSDKAEFERILDENNRKLVDEMRRMQKI